jgi:hypothetical protein
MPSIAIAARGMGVAGRRPEMSLFSFLAVVADFGVPPNMLQWTLSAKVKFG